jgi:hypothetical protein
MKNPNFKVGNIVTDYNGEDSYKVLKISDNYEDVREYDDTGGGLEMKAIIAEGELDKDEWWYVAARNMDDETYAVWGSTEDSIILGL